MAGHKRKARGPDKKPRARRSRKPQTTLTSRDVGSGVGRFTQTVLVLCFPNEFESFRFEVVRNFGQTQMKLPTTVFIDGRGVRFVNVQSPDHTIGYPEGTRLIVRGSMVLQRIFWRRFEEQMRLYDALADRCKIALPKGLEERNIG